jgi:two-component system NtrC family sensor kinase
VFVTGDTLNASLEDFAINSGRPLIEKPFLPGEVRRIVAAVAAGERRVSAQIADAANKLVG